MNQAVTIVLLIDGDPMARAVTAGTLKGCGCSVIPVRDAADGLETFTAHHTDIALVVADVRLPDMDGVTLLQAIRAIDARIPVIVMTGSDPAEIGQYQHAPVAGLLSKPFRADEFVAVVLHTLHHATSALDSLVVPPDAPGARVAPSRASATGRSAATSAPRAMNPSRPAEPSRPAASTPFAWPAAPGASSSTPASRARRNRDRRTGEPGPSFHWPPRREDLDIIQVVDAKTLRAVSEEPELDAFPPSTAAGPPATAVREPAAGILERVLPFMPKGTIARMPMVSASLETHAHRSPLSYRLRTLRANRLIGATAAALFGIAVTTYIEARLTSPRTRTVRAQDTAAHATVNTPVPMTSSVPVSHVFGKVGLVRAQNVTSRPVGPMMAPLPPAAAAPVAVPAIAALTTPSRATFTARREDGKAAEPSGFRKLLVATKDQVTEHIAKPTGKLAASAARHLGVLPESSARDVSRRRSSKESARQASRQLASRRETKPPHVASRAVTMGVPQGLPYTRTSIDYGLAALRAPEPPPAAPVAAATSTANSTSRPSSAVSASAAANRPADEQRIYATLKQYEHAYERLDANAARAVWPSVDTRGLARAFGGLKTQELEFARCDLAVQTAEATAVCGGRATYVPRVGNQQRHTESREWTFRLKKVDQSWMIVKAEAR